MITSQYMNRLEKDINQFIVLCIELFAKDKSILSQKSYLILEENSLLDELVNDFEDLHGMSSSFLVYYMDQLIRHKTVELSKIEKSEHLQTNIGVKIIIISRVIEMISEKYRLPLKESRELLYQSEVINLIEDDETGLYGEDPSFSFQLFISKKRRSSF